MFVFLSAFVFWCGLLLASNEGFVLDSLSDFSDLFEELSLLSSVSVLFIDCGIIVYAGFGLKNSSRASK